MAVHHPEHALSPQHALSRPDAETLRLVVQLPAVASMKELEVDLASRAVTVSGAAPMSRITGAVASVTVTVRWASASFPAASAQR